MSNAGGRRLSHLARLGCLLLSGTFCPSLPNKYDGTKDSMMRAARMRLEGGRVWVPGEYCHILVYSSPSVCVAIE